MAAHFQFTGLVNGTPTLIRTWSGDFKMGFASRVTEVASDGTISSAEFVNSMEYVNTLLGNEQVDIDAAMTTWNTGLMDPNTMMTWCDYPILPQVARASSPVAGAPAPTPMSSQSPSLHRGAVGDRERSWDLDAERCWACNALDGEYIMSLGDGLFCSINCRDIWHHDNPDSNHGARGLPEAWEVAADEAAKTPVAAALSPVAYMEPTEEVAADADEEMAMAMHLSMVDAEHAEKASQSLQQQNALVVAIESPEQGDDPHEQVLPAENESSPTNRL